MLLGFFCRRSEIAEECARGGLKGIRNSWKAAICQRVVAMNPPPAPPRRGASFYANTLRTPLLGGVKGWVGSWAVSTARRSVLVPGTRILRTSVLECSFGSVRQGVNHNIDAHWVGILLRKVLEEPLVLSFLLPAVAQIGVPTN